MSDRTLNCFKSVMRPVWPDVGIKGSPNFSLKLPNGATAVLSLKVIFVKRAPKVTKYFGYFENKVGHQEL